MNDTGKLALAIVTGYYLGRRHKLRMATAMAATVLVRRLKRNGGGTLLGMSPELDALTGRLRGELLDLTKSAATAAAVKQIESLTERLQQAGQTGQGSQENQTDQTDQTDETDRADEAEEEPAEEESEEAEGGAAGEESAEDEEDRSAKSRIPKPRLPKPHMPKAADRVAWAAAAGIGRRKPSDRDETRE
ncbi:hypothetical protein MF672_019025 [Actinomadura sp. ATCC 31491]|uniref:DNA primase n=1 Tax=Actinomadura luzonensis TaxID=2805427 RepID=A0ABT0FU83_9ACTN|nr:hypothetical protein [Actinomadura luzonensis]MCK2215872.1 hypothetical protein [Actinomadura luzonensis]